MGSHVQIVEANMILKSENGRGKKDEMIFWTFNIIQSKCVNDH